MARALRLSVTAEGVETVEQLSELRARGCETAQGFLIARPEPHEVVEALLLAEERRPPAQPLEAPAADVQTALEPVMEAVAQRRAFPAETSMPRSPLPAR